MVQFAKCIQTATNDYKEITLYKYVGEFSEYQNKYPPICETERPLVAL